MLRRGDSKSSNRLNRKKSTSSDHTRRDSIDPDAAHRDAHAAATLAFLRAQERNSADMGGIHGMTWKNSTITHQETQKQQPERWTADDQGDRVVKRQQSVRFTGPRAVRRRQSIGTRAINGTIESCVTPVAQRPRALTNDASVPAAYRPPSRSSSIGKASLCKGNAQRFITLDAYDEYYTREDDIASTPSSYRRIRKSKSMLGPLKRTPSILFSNGTPESACRSNLRNIPPNSQNSCVELEIRAPKSMSFLRGGKDHMPSRLRDDHDGAVQVARDKFLHQVEQQRLREQPSFLFRSKSRRQEKPFPQSLRTSSGNSYGTAIGSANQMSVVVNEGSDSLRVKARKASQSLKNKLKGLFRRGTADSEPPLIPDQQVESQKSHGLENFMSSATTLHGSYDDIPHPSKATMSRVSSRVPSLHAVPSNQQLRSRTGSFQSLKSEISAKSRVTSWNSTADENTADSRYSQAERERQRLSIIQENGTHFSSASFKRPGFGPQFSVYTSFHHPRGTDTKPLSNGGPDCHKLYTALKQRIDEKIPNERVIRRIPSMESIGPPTPIPPRTSSVQVYASTHQSNKTPTIRQVSESSEVSAPVESHSHKALESEPQDQDDLFSPKTSCDSNHSSGVLRNRHEPTISDGKSVTIKFPRKPSYRAYPLPEVGDEPRVTPQLLADRNEGLPTRRGLRESRSTFFGHTGFTISRTTSPYRRALAVGDYNPAVVTGDTPLRPSPLRSPPLLEPTSHSRPAQTSLETPHIAYSESVYSRTTNGQPPSATFSTITLIAVPDGSLPDKELIPATYRPTLPTHDDQVHASDEGLIDRNGSALIVDRVTYRPTLPSHRPQQSSADLRAWMSAQVATLEKQKDDPRTAIEFASPTIPKSLSHHVREHAQISPEDTDFLKRKISQPKQAAAPVIQQNAHISNFQIPQRKLTHQQEPHRNIQQNNSLACQQTALKPIINYTSVTSIAEIPIPPAPPPPPPLPPMPTLPFRSPLRQRQSRSSMRSVRTTNSEQSSSVPTSSGKLIKRENRQVMQNRSNNTVRNADTPAKLTKKNTRPVTYTHSPGLDAAVSKQFGSTGARTPHSEKQPGQVGSSTGSRTPFSTPYGGNENQAPFDSGPRRNEQYRFDEPALMEANLDDKITRNAPAKGNQRMVDRYLSDRRRRMAGSDDTNAFV